MSELEISTPKQEIDHRISRLQQYLKDKGIHGALILQNTDLFYYAGTIQQSHLYVPSNGKPILMTRKSFSRAKSESPIENIIRLSSPRDIFPIIKESGLPVPEIIGMELDVLPANLYFSYSEIFDKISIKDISQGIREIRSVKSEYEIDLIRQAAQYSDQVAEKIPEIIKEGMTEIELAGLVEAEMRKLGHQGLVRMRHWGSEMFYGHIMSGPSAAVPSYIASPTGGASVSPAFAHGAGFRKIQRNEPILVDYVFAWQGYLSDHTRIYCLGNLSDDLVSAHRHMLDIQEHIKEIAKPGVEVGDIYQASLEMAVKQGFEDSFMGAPGKERIRFVGHGVGLELDELPILAQGQTMVLKKGMVIAFEPKLVIPGRGVVGIENIHLVTDRGFEQMTLFNEDINRV